MDCSIKTQFVNKLESVGAISPGTNLISNLQQFERYRDAVRQKLKEQFGIESDLITIVHNEDGSQTFEFIESTINELNQKSDSEEGMQTNFNVRAAQAHKKDLKLNVDLTQILQYKKNLLHYAQAELNRIRQQLKDPEIKTDPNEFKRLVERETELDKLIRGDNIKKKRGLRQEIALLEDPTYMVTATIEEFFQSDLDQVRALVQSNDYNDIKRAKEIIDFWKATGDFDSSKKHPLFDNEELYAGTNTVDSKGRKVAPGTIMLQKNQIDFFQQIHRTMSNLDNLLQIKERQAIEDGVGAMSQASNLAPDEISYNNLFFVANGLKDINVIDKFIMDPSNGIFSSNGLVPQIAMIHLQERMEENAAYSKKFSARISAIQDKCEKWLLGTKDPREPNRKVNKHNMYDLFYARDETGQRTDKLVQQYSRKYFDRLGHHSRAYNEAIGRMDRTAHLPMYDKLRKSAIANYRKVINDYHKFLRSNTETLNPFFVLGKDYFYDSQGNLRPSFLGTGMETMLQKIEQNGVDNTDEIKRLIGDKNFAKLKAEMEEQMKAFEIKMDTYQAQMKQRVQDEIANTLKKTTNFTPAEMRIVNDITQKANNDWTEHFVRNSPIHFIVSQMENSVTVEVNGYNYYTGDIYTSKVPKDKVTVTDPNGFTTTNDSGYYDEAYKHIATSPEALEMLELIDEGLTTVHRSLDPETKRKLGSPASIPALERSISDILMDPTISILTRISKAIKEIWHRLRESFGKKLSDNISHVRRNVITGEANYKVDNSWLKTNKSEINNRMFEIELDIRNLLGLKEHQTLDKNYNLVQNPQLLAYLNSKIGLPPNTSVYDLMKQFGDKYTPTSVPVMKLIRSSIMNDVMAEQSLDLPRIMKLHVDAAMLYKARNEALPFIEMVKKHYQQIKAVGTNAGNEELKDKDGKPLKQGLRTNANEQFENWFQMRVLGNFESRNEFAQGDAKTEKEADNSNYFILGKSRYFIEPNTNKIVRGERKRLRTRIDAELERIKSAMNNAKNSAQESILQERAERLVAKRNEVNSIEFSVTAVIDNLLNFLRFKALGYNISSAMTNLWEGQVSNSLVAYSGKYFDPVHIHRANRIVGGAFAKGVTAGKVTPKGAKKLRILMDRYDILQDMANELQKSSNVSAAHKYTSKLHPFELTQRVEYLNQTPLVVAKMLDTKIKGKDGKESSLWDAMDENGMLLPEFATDENKAAWEDAKHKDYYAFKINVSKMIVNTHGDYSNVRGSLHKTYLTGKSIGMFKGWLPRMIYTYLGKEQMDIETGTVDKGRLRSASVSTGAIYGLMGGMLIFGPFSLMTGLTAGLGFGMAKFFEGNNNLKGDVSILRDLAITAKDAFHTAYRLPINIMTMGKVQLKDKITNRYDNEVDQQNYRAMLANISLICTMMVMKIAVQALLGGVGGGDDDDEEGGLGLAAKNLLMNKLMQWSDQAVMFASPTGNPIVTYAQPAPLMWFKDIYDYCTKTIEAGQHDAKTFNKAFMPAIGKPWGGMGSWTSKQFNKDWTDNINPDGATIKRQEKENKKKTKKILKSKYGDDYKAAESVLNKKLKQEEKRNKGMTAKERMRIAIQIAENLPDSKVRKAKRERDKREKAKEKKKMKEKGRR